MAIKRLNEWLKDRGIEELSSNDFGMKTYHDEGIIENQLDQLATRVEGIIGDLDQDQKAALLKKFIANLQMRVG